MLLLLPLVLAVAQPVVEAPAPICSQWHGSVRGNDPDVTIDVTLCEVGDNQVRGTLAWASKQSGTSLRALAGNASGKTVALRDVDLRGKPNAGWRFCLVDRYTLTRSDGDTLTGTYHSTACHDEATIALKRVR
jgi:hypothetical protein